MKFLIKKFIKNRKTQIIFVILVGILGFSFYAGRAFDESPTTPDSLQVQIQNTQQVIKNLENDIEKNAGVPDAAQHLKEVKEFLPLYSGQKQALIDKDYDKYYELQDKLNVINLTDPSIDSMSTALTKDSILWFRAVKKSGQVFPLSQGEDPQGFGVALELNNNMSWITILVVIGLLVGDFMSLEFPQGLRFYELIKTSRRKLIFHYFLTPVFVAFSAVAVVYLIYFLVIGFWKGWGSPMFPYSMPGPYVVTPVWQVGLWALVYLLFGLIFLTSLGQLLTVLFKRAYLSTVVLAVIMVGYSQLQTQPFMKSVIKFVPLTYLGSGSVFGYSGSRIDAWPFGGEYLFGTSSLWIGLGYLLMCSVVFYLLANFLFGRYIYRKV